MPPYVPRKRMRDASPPVDSTAKGKAPAKTAAIRTPARKATLYDDLDASATPLSSKPSESLLHGLGSEDSDSGLTSLSDSDFEDVPLAKRQKLGDSDDDDDEEIEFEDVAAPTVSAVDAPVTSGDLELTLTKDARVSLTNPFGEKKGPSKRERMVRNATHCLHVMTLLWHNAVRNSWLCHPEIQAMMISHLTPRLWDEVDRWRRHSGLEKPVAETPSRRGKGKGKATKGKGKGKGKLSAGKDRQSRDWPSTADMLEDGAVDMSHGDPLFRLMQSLTSWWKQRFRVTQPGLRKQGYMSLERLDRLTKAYKIGADFDDANRFGERVSNIQDLLRCAQKCQGSRDVGAQLFVALLRGLGLDARLVANVQCLGFGWNKLEDAEPEKEENVTKQEVKAEADPDKKSGASQGKQIKSENEPGRGHRGRAPRSKEEANYVILDDTDDLELETQNTDDESVVELEVLPKRAAKPAKQFDKDLQYPHYWVEALSPITHQYLPADPIVKGIVGTNRELVESLEPRGAKADKARQIMAYIVGYGQDGTAKDVTVRYLKRQMLPGRTKGARMPLVKVPVYDRNGKVKRNEHFDWFKTAMSGYTRGGRDHPLTEIDETEDSTDLKPAKPEKKEVKEGEETLQYYKQSKEFFLQRHLKREEALKPGAIPVKIFKNKAKSGNTEEEDVFLRSDVLLVKSAETWHKQGRAPLPGEEPLKRVPYRAATLNRRRELLEAEAATGQKVLQGLYSFDQTTWIIPPPIQDGIIPKNGYGNIDLFVEHMCPEGAVHVPFRGTMKVCKRLQIDYAEAVVDFEFGHRMAVPVIQGVVIAQEFHDQVMEELEKDEAERARKEDEKRRKTALGRWRKFLMGMRIVERIRQDYGEIDDSVSVFGHHKGLAVGDASRSAQATDHDMAGGFLPEGYEEEDAGGPAQHTSNFFPVGDEDEAGDDGGLIMEDHRHEAVGEPSKGRAVIDASGSKSSKGSRRVSTAKRNQATRGRASTRRKQTVVEEEDDDDSVEEEEEEWVNPDGDDDDDYE